MFVTYSKVFKNRKIKYTIFYMLFFHINLESTTVRTAIRYQFEK